MGAITHPASVPDPRDRQLCSYDYVLPEERIAQVPVEPRHAARLLMVPPVEAAVEQARHQQVWDWQQELQPGDLLVVNDTRVLKARLRVRRSGGGLAEMLVLEPRGDGKWLCLGRPAKKMRPGDQLWLESLEQDPLELQVLATVCIGNEQGPLKSQSTLRWTVPQEIDLQDSHICSWSQL